MSLQRAGPYALEAPLGRGGAGEVFRARGPDGAVVAVKLLRTRGGVDRFERECRVQTELARAGGGFVPIIAGGDGPTGPWIAMPLLEGGTLRDRLRRGPLAPAEVLRLGQALADALGRAHALGFVHRDVKPENVLLDGAGAPLLADMGLAKHLEGDARLGLSRSLSVTGEVRGTISYLAPECVQDTKHADPRADVFSLGAVLYEAAAGAPAFQAQTQLAVLARVASGRFRPLGEAAPDLPPGVARVIERCLSPTPGTRPKDGAALAGPRGRRAPAQPAAGPAAPRGGRRYAAAALGGAAALARRPRAPADARARRAAGPAAVRRAAAGPRRGHRPGPRRPARRGAGGPGRRRDRARGRRHGPLPPRPRAHGERRPGRRARGLRGRPRRPAPADGPPRARPRRAGGAAPGGGRPRRGPRRPRRGDPPRPGRPGRPRRAGGAPPRPAPPRRGGRGGHPGARPGAPARPGAAHARGRPAGPG
ncbi:MAG: serine/threonine protein kinase [Planctomycetes bacterium]|nr:serine/threonine protein kinase [Planctomycetota bacterium]